MRAVFVQVYDFAVDNYEFCADFAAKRGGKVLDYGCGAGQIVKILRSKGLEAFGCDVYYAASGDRPKAEPLIAEGLIREMPDGRIPFDDASFDLVISNQVFEHVPDLDTVLSEIRRVLKPGGTLLSLFPCKETWREAHFNAPFLHWFPRGSKTRLVLCAFGVPKRAGPWVDKWCHYRTYREIHATFSRYLSAPRHMESEWLDKRKPALSFLPEGLKTFIVRKGASLVFECQKH